MLNKIELINYSQALIEKDEVTNTLLLDTAVMNL